MTTSEIRIVDMYGEQIDILRGRIEEAMWSVTEIPTASISFRPTAAGAMNTKVANKVEYQLWLNGRLRWWGLARDIDGDSRRLTMPLVGLYDYFLYRFILDTNEEWTADMVQIAWNLLQYAQSGYYDDLNINAANWAPTGEVITRAYTSDRKHNIWEALSEFPTLEPGFEHSIEFTEDGGRFWTPYYPRKGEYKNIPLIYGANIVGYTYKETARKLCTLADTTGGAVKQEDPLAGLPFPPREKQFLIQEDVAMSAKHHVHAAVIPSGARSDMDWLQRKGLNVLSARGDVIKVPSVTCRIDPPWPNLLEEVEPGDTLPVTIQHGRVTIEQDCRVKNMYYDGNKDQVRFDFVSEAEAV